MKKVTILILSILMFITCSGDVLYGKAADLEFIINNGVLSKYTGLATEVSIPEGVTEIKKSTFFRNTEITSVVIPDSVQKIEASAFSGCTNLTNVVLPDSLTKLPMCVFSDCSNLTNINLNAITTIGDSAFEHCKKLEQAELSNVVEIDSHAFSGCTNLTSVDLTSIEILKYMAFWNSGLMTVTGLERLKTVEGNVFGVTPFSEQLEKNQGISRMLIKNGILIMTASCTGKVIIPSNVTEIAPSAFSSKHLTSITIPATVKKIGSSAFAGCYSLSSVRVEGAMTEIGEYAFERCARLRNVRLPQNLKILDMIFYNAKKLYNLTIPKGIESIHMDSLDGCSGLQYITIDSSMTETTCNELLSALSSSGSEPIIYADITKLDSKVKAAIEASYALKNIQLLKSKLSLSLGTSFELRMTGHAKCDSWSSSNPKVATVNYYGKVVPKSKGTTIITAKLYGKEYTCTVTIR